MTSFWSMLSKNQTDQKSIWWQFRVFHLAHVLLKSLCIVAGYDWSYCHHQGAILMILYTHTTVLQNKSRPAQSNQVNGIWSQSWCGCTKSKNEHFFLLNVLNQYCGVTAILKTSFCVFICYLQRAEQFELWPTFSEGQKQKLGVGPLKLFLSTF